MRIYQVTVTETREHCILVEASSHEEAQKVALKTVERGVLYGEAQTSRLADRSTRVPEDEYPILDDDEFVHGADESVNTLRREGRLPPAEPA